MKCLPFEMSSGVLFIFSFGRTLHLSKDIKMSITIKVSWDYEVVIAQWLARRLASDEVRGSNPGKGETY